MIWSFLAKWAIGGGELVGVAVFSVLRRAEHSFWKYDVGTRSSEARLVNRARWYAAWETWWQARKEREACRQVVPHDPRYAA